MSLSFDEVTQRMGRATGGDRRRRELLGRGADHLARGGARTPPFVALQAALAAPGAIRALVEGLAAAIDGLVLSILPGPGHLAPVTHTESGSCLLLQGLARATWGLQEG
jgi:hypothetical protein